MRNEVEVIRESVAKITRILAGRDIQVTQSGVHAFVQYHPRTNEPVRINIPYLPDTASRELVQATQGFIDHEVAHILFTDEKAVVAANAKGKRTARMHNIVEDVFIERKMGERFRGSDFNLDRVREWMIEDVWQGGVDKLDANPDATSAQYFFHLIVPIFRAWAGQAVCDRWLADKWTKLEPALKGTEFIREGLLKLDNSWDCLALAERIVEFLEEKPKEEDEAGDGEAADEGEPGEAGESKSGKSKSEDHDDEGDEKDDDDADTDDGEEDDAPDEDDATDEEDADEEGDEASGENADEGDEGESAGDAAEGDGSETLDGDAFDGEDSDEDIDGGEAGDVSATGDDGEDAGGSDPSDGTDKTEEDDSGWDETDEEEIFSAIDGACEEMEGALRARVSSLFNADAGAAPWLVFTTDNDSIATYEPRASFNEHTFNRFEGGINSMIGPMSKELERMLLAQNRSRWNPGLRRGRLNPSSLHRLRAGDDRVFRRRVETKAKETAVELVVDLSGSMGGAPITVAMQSAYALALTLERCRIPCEVIGFTTMDVPERVVHEMGSAETELGRRYSRHEALNMPIFKGWNERMNAKARWRFADLPGRRDYFLRNNVDNECVEIAGKRLMHRPEQRKVMIVLSDGEPAHRGDYVASGMLLRKAVKNFERAGVETVGIGIMTSAVERFYSKNVVVNSVDELPKVLVGELRRILLK